MSRFHVDPNEHVDVFEFDPDETISTTPPNVITIRARMSVEVAGRVSSELMQLGADNKLEAHVGAHVGALLLHNILSWRGPDFDDLPCTPANIRALPSPESDPFISKVADAIAQRNRARSSPNPKSAATPATSASAGVVAYPTQDRDDDRGPLLRANGIAKSVLRSDSDGRPRKLAP
jgi:hypothetical protein